MKPVKAALVLLMALAFMLSPILSSGFSGFTADQFPVPQTDPPIQPTGWTFAVIWSVIYLWLGVMAVFGLFRRSRNDAWDHTRWPLIASLALGAAWIPVANLSPIWATVMIWAMLVTALWALIRTPAQDGFWLQAPLGLYAGWLTAAANVGTAVVATGYGATPVQPIHAAFLVVASWIALTLARLGPGYPFYLLAMLWASFGILVDNLLAGRMIFAGLAAVVMGVLIPAGWRNYTRFRARRGQPPTPRYRPQ
ncbi:hypothetical protein DL237_18920 [Pseudooceanicola sediminis]|uniref:Tryptophan-rich sensory protein n=1 Tax=Pseudooceanicola sediminis TaxID=2211117 RepID=A0A399IVL7_9RHOB|nr:tryptophan-rich sensory protein [Pseudooceanicola sediminis]KAA2312705.1 hypothetical protein E0K93_16285 [Puniceibacterium sp. HSS470]RII37081.1 hypothetical protein DL237_18920 [Pseudooceanicola sediminis]